MSDPRMTAAEMIRQSSAADEKHRAARKLKLDSESSRPSGAGLLALIVASVVVGVGVLVAWWHNRQPTLEETMDGIRVFIVIGLIAIAALYFEERKSRR